MVQISTIAVVCITVLSTIGLYLEIKSSKKTDDPILATLSTIAATLLWVLVLLCWVATFFIFKFG